jgi:hypothetical protein
MLRPELKKILGLTYDEAERQFRNGYIAEPVFRAYCATWVWSSYRFSNICNADCKQGAFYERFGSRALHDRINKVRVACGFSPRNWNHNENRSA